MSWPHDHTYDPDLPPVLVIIPVGCCGRACLPVECHDWGMEWVCEKCHRQGPPWKFTSEERQFVVRPQYRSRTISLTGRPAGRKARV